jgi:NitT/TauT family transport system substrate-binding protein
MIAAQITLGASANAQTPPASLIRIGSTPNDSYAEPFYAEDRGFFARDGLNATVEPFATGAGVTAALAGNAIDVGITNPISLANAYEHGVPFVFFAVAADSPIQQAKDLNGKTVGTTAIRDSNSLHVVAWIDQNGGDSSTVHLVELPFSAMAPALKRGTVAAVPIAEPTLSAVLKEGGVRIIGHPMDVYGKHFMVGGWFARPDYLVANAALMRRLRATIYSTAVWANAHPDESAVSLAKYAKLDPEVVRTMNRSPYGTALTPDMLQPYLDLGYKYKYIGRQLKATDLIVKL